uniref:Uncharacterized protein n=1 Tax=Aegilops tauschii subsp. strangulata TaxID=200361 RepID=A0A453H3H0_AEGTS
MAACPAATTARVGAAHGGGLWRRSGRSPSLLARLARGTSTTARASELQQAPAPAPAAVVPTHKVTVHDRERGVVHHFLVPQGPVHSAHRGGAGHHAPLRLPPWLLH